MQGQESDIVIASLTRDNMHDPEGTVPPALAYLTMSKARNGLFLFGNMDLLSDCSPQWDEIKKNLQKSGRFGTELPLRCDKHRHVTLKVALLRSEFKLSNCNICSRSNRCRISLRTQIHFVERSAVTT